MRIFAQVSMQICSVLETCIGRSINQTESDAQYKPAGEGGLRGSIFLRIPLARADVALAGLPQVVRLLQINLANLLLSVSGLPEAPRAGEVDDGLRKRLDGDCGLDQPVRSAAAG